MEAGLGDGSHPHRLVVLSAPIAVLATGFVALAAMVWETNGLVALDRAANQLLGRAVDAVFASPSSPGSISPLRADDVVHLGSRTTVIVAAFALGLLALAWGDRVAALVAVAGPGLTGALTEYVIKPLVNVPSPVGARTFPSGHAGGAAAIALVVVVLVQRRWGRWPCLAAAVLAAVFASAVAAALLHLRFHYPTDIVGGALLAAVVVLGLTACLSRYTGPGHRLLAGEDERSALPRTRHVANRTSSG